MSSEPRKQERDRAPARPVRGGRGMRGGSVKDIDKGLLRRLLGLLMHDYPVRMVLIAACIAASAARRETVRIVPSAGFMTAL